MLDCRKVIHLMCEVLGRVWKWRDKIDDIQSDESRWAHLAVECNIEEKKWKYHNWEDPEKRMRRSIPWDVLTLNEDVFTGDFSLILNHICWTLYLKSHVLGCRAFLLLFDYFFPSIVFVLSKKTFLRWLLDFMDLYRILDF